MKRIPLVLGTIALLAALPAAGQAQGLMGGIKAGVNIATIDSDDDEGVESRTGFVGGGFLNFALSPMFSIQPEVLYSQKGAKMSESDPDFGTFDATFKLDYIEVPLLLKLGFGGATGGPSFNVFAGPAIGFKMSCKVKIEVDSPLGGGEDEVDCDDESLEGFDVKSTDVGAAFGAGIRFPLGRSALVLDGRYTLGLTNIADVPEGVEDAGDAKNRAFSIMAGWSIPLGGAR